MQNKKLITDPKEARRAAMNYLARREHSTQEICRKLSVRVENEAVVESVVQQLQNDGLLSDVRFTQAYVRYRSNKGFGPTKISIELRDKGVNENTIQDQLDPRKTDWIELGKTAKEKKFGRLPATSIDEKAKQVRFLSQRGFSYEQIEASLTSTEED